MEPRDLTVRAYAFTVSGDPLPEGSHARSFDGERDIGAVTSHSEIRRTFRAGGVHLVRLTVTLAGVTLPVSCVDGCNHLADQARVTVWPTVTGLVYDTEGRPLAGVQITLHGSDLSTTTDAAGAYALSVPYESSGLLTPALEGYEFAPEAWSFSSLRSDLGSINFRASGGTAPPDNRPPDALGQLVETYEDAAATITLAAVDADGDPLTYTILTLPGHGSLADVANGHLVAEGELPYTLDAGGDRVVYSPQSDFNGRDSFAFRADDGVAGSEPSVADVRLSVTPVNDPPSFSVPADRWMNAETCLTVTMTSVSPGPADEAEQTVAFSAHSSNQAIIPDANLTFEGNQLTITAAASGGPVTVTVTAQDDGGRAHGGKDCSEGSFTVTVAGGPMVFGTIRRVETVGANPPVGPIGLVFAGSGVFSGTGLTITTDVNGNYAVAMPEGWTGSLSAENADCCYLTPPCWEFTEPLSAPQQQDFTAWCPPIGVPVPEFGLREQVLLPDPWDQPLVGFYYVDNTHPNASDSDNPYGYPDRPRLSMPGLTGLPAGTVIHVNAGDYYSGGARAVTGAGTPEQPVFIRGNPANRPRFAAKLSVQNSASYIIIENIDFDGTLNDNGYAGVEFVFGAHHVALRNSALHHRNGTCIQIYGAAGIPVHDILVYNSVIHDNGDWHADHDQDFHGIGVGAHVSDLSVLDNQFYHNSGNGVQVNAGSLANLPTAHHIYVARNEGHHNKQAGIALKQCQDVIVSQNSVHDQRPIGANPSDWGAGIGFQYGPENVWFLCNHIHDCCYGIYGGSTSGMGDGQNSYFIGNVIHDIHHDPAYPYNPDTAWSNAALMLVGVPNRSIINNTVYTVDSGINGPSSGVYELVDNIISNITEEQGKHIFLEHAEAADVSIVRNDLLYQDGEPVRIVWGSGTVYDLKGFQTATGEGEGSLDADARFVDEATRDLHLRADSPAVNAGIEHEAYATFFDLYGIDIRVDADGWPRPPGEAGEVDIGAFELAAD